jgi:UDP-glucose 4-epimerase
MRRDYVYVQDVVNANIAALLKANLKALNIGTGIETTTGQLLREICQQLNKKYNPQMGDPRPGDIRKSCLLNDAAKEFLGWKPEYSISAGIMETIQFFSRR